MSMLEIGMLAGIGLIVLAIYLVYRQPVVTIRAGGLGYEEQERRFQPVEIANGILVMSEQYLRSTFRAAWGAVLTRCSDAGWRSGARRHEDGVPQRGAPGGLGGAFGEAAVLRHTTAGARPAGRMAIWGYVRKVAPGRNPMCPC